MEADKGVRVQPMAADAVPTVHHDHADVRVVEQRVRERHPRRARADHQIVGLQHLDHGLMLIPAESVGQALPGTVVVA